MAEVTSLPNEQICNLCKDIERGKLGSVKKLLREADRLDTLCKCFPQRPISRLTWFYQKFLGLFRTWRDSMPQSAVWECPEVYNSTVRLDVLEIMANMLAGGLPVNYCTGKETPIMAAMLTFDYHLMGTLLEFGADVNLRDGDQGMNAVGLAILLNDVSLVEFVLKHRGNVNQKCCNKLLPIQLAFNKKTEISTLLIQNGADADFLSHMPLKTAVYAHNSPLLFAITCRNTHLAELLLEYGEDPNQTLGENPETALHLAIREDDLSMVSLLARFGASLNQANNEGQTPLGLAIALNKPNGVEIAKRLIKGGANPRKKSRVHFFQNDFSPFYIACYKGNFQLVKYLAEEVFGKKRCDSELKILQQQVESSINNSSVLNSGDVDRKQIKKPVEKIMASQIVDKKKNQISGSICAKPGSLGESVNSNIGSGCLKPAAKHQIKEPIETVNGDFQNVAHCKQQIIVEDSHGDKNFTSFESVENCQGRPDQDDELLKLSPEVIVQTSDHCIVLQKQGDLFMTESCDVSGGFGNDSKNINIPTSEDSWAKFEHSCYPRDQNNIIDSSEQGLDVTVSQDIENTNSRDDRSVKYNSFYPKTGNKGHCFHLAAPFPCHFSERGLDIRHSFENSHVRTLQDSSSSQHQYCGLQSYEATRSTFQHSGHWRQSFHPSYLPRCSRTGQDYKDQHGQTTCCMLCHFQNTDSWGKLPGYTPLLDDLLSYQQEKSSRPTVCISDDTLLSLQQLYADEDQQKLPCHCLCQNSLRSVPDYLSETTESTAQQALNTGSVSESLEKCASSLHEPTVGHFSSDHCRSIDTPPAYYVHQPEGEGMLKDYKVSSPPLTAGLKLSFDSHRFGYTYTNQPCRDISSGLDQQCPVQDSSLQNQSEPRNTIVNIPRSELSGNLWQTSLELIPQQSLPAYATALRGLRPSKSHFNTANTETVTADSDVEQVQVDFINQTTHDGFTPLFMAVFAGSIETVLYLVNAGARTDFECRHGNFFHAAVLSGCRPLVQLAAEFNCDVNCINSFGSPPLILASRLNSPEVCEELAINGADLNARDKNQETALLGSVYFGCEFNARVLIQHGAALGLTDNDNTSALYWCIYNNRERTLRLLMMAGVCLTPYMLETSYSRNLTIKRNKKLKAWIKDHNSQPKTLQSTIILSLRRLLIQRSSGRSIHNSIQALPVPEPIKDQLLLKNCCKEIDAVMLEADDDSIYTN